jgi:hypothetical protein
MICDGCTEEVYRARLVGEKWLCKRCDPGPARDASVSGSMFPFTTTHMSQDPSKPVVVQSLRHLRKLERQHGVQSVAFNQNSNNFDPPRR